MHDTADSTIDAWLTGRIPTDWTATAPPSIVIDREEITITISVTEPSLADGASDADRAESVAGRITGFREDTRDQRMAIARDAEHRFGRKVAWAVEVGGRTELFTHIAVPVMTRLRQPERLVLDTLVAANVARSRADALAWCVRLVGQNTDEWLTELRTAMTAVDDVRAKGPDAT
ncbi:MAG: hypothetical protein ABJH68_19545 [Ilumatobacter sp.]|uniref:hypothetical protein n=1 Tax=Ilumatobacter sp. TaxID=1967498 RepID=UPI003299F149